MPDESPNDPAAHIAGVNLYRSNAPETRASLRAAVSVAVVGAAVVGTGVGPGVPVQSVPRHIVTKCCDHKVCSTVTTLPSKAANAMHSQPQRNNIVRSRRAKALTNSDGHR